MLAPATLWADGHVVDKPPVLSADAIEALVSAIWGQTLPLPDAPPAFEPGEHALTAAERATIAHAVWARSLP